MRKLLVVTALLLFAGIAFGQTLKSGNMVAVHQYDIILQPDVTSNQLLEFFETTYIPTFEKVFPGTKLYTLIGERGDQVHKIGGMIIFDSKEIRDKIYPEEGGGVQMNEEQQKAMQMLNEGINKLVLSMSSIYTDWMVQ